MEGGGTILVQRTTSGADRLERWLAYGLWALCELAAVLGLLYGVAEQASGRSAIEQTVVSYLVAVVVTTAYASVGLLLRIRRPDVSVGWLFLGIGFVAAFSNLTWAYGLLALASGVAPGPLEASEVAWFGNAVLAPGWLASAIALVLVFPDGRAPTPRWRAVLLLMLPIGLLAALGLAFIPGQLTFFTFFDNPHGATGASGSLATGLAFVSLALLTVIAAFTPYAVWGRYRRAHLLEQLQLKWFAWAATLVLIAGVLEIVLASTMTGQPGLLADAAWVVFSITATLVPVAALVAMLRYRLYDIDRVIGRTFVYGALTAILAGLYAASIRLFTSFFVDVTRQSSDTALVLTTLVLATTFTPIKTWLEGIAAARFRTTRGPDAVPAASPTLADAMGAPGPVVAVDALEGESPVGGSLASTHGSPESVEDLDARIAAIAEAVARRVIDEQLHAGSESRTRSARDARQKSNQGNC